MAACYTLLMIEPTTLRTGQPTGAHLAPLLIELSSRLWGPRNFVALRKTDVIVLVEALKSMGYEAAMTNCNVEMVMRSKPEYSAHLPMHGIELEPGAIFSGRLFANWDEVIQEYVGQIYSYDPKQAPGWKPPAPYQVPVDPAMILLLAPSEMKLVLDILPTARELIFDISGAHLDNNTLAASGSAKRLTL